MVVNAVLLIVLAVAFFATVVGIPVGAVLLIIAVISLCK
jgi:hypothetical protein